MLNELSGRGGVILIINKKCVQNQTDWHNVWKKEPHQSVRWQILQKERGVKRAVNSRDRLVDS